jgi:hypothetical protein
MHVGQPFNPFRLFNGIFIPEGLVPAKCVSPGAKLAYGRLVRYAGQDGECYPAVPTLAAEIGVSVRQTQYYLSELEREQLVRRVIRISESGQTSNAYEFLWHPLLEAGVKRTAPEGVKKIAPEGVQDLSPKESQIQERYLEKTNSDLDYPLTKRKNRDSRPDAALRAGCRQYPRLREALADYMARVGEERIYPSERVVVDILDAAGGASEEEVISCLRYLRQERGLAPGSKNGPKHFSWFKTVMTDYFAQKRDRDLVTGNGPCSGNAAMRLNNEQFETMTGAFSGSYPEDQENKRARRSSAGRASRRGWV